MLKKLLSSSVQKQIVGVSLAPGIGLEAVIYDRNKNVVTNYGRKPVEYNFSTREIQDYVEFKAALVELMDEMGIAPKTPIYLVLPNVYFDFTDIPASLENYEIKAATLSKAEEFYMFKKEEPASGWCEVAPADASGQRRIAYSSFQLKTVDEIKEVVTDIGLQLVGIESSYSATARGLYLTGYIDSVILENANWSLMYVNTNSYTLLNFVGKDLVQCSEVPIAIKSFSTEEAYGAIASSSAQLLGESNSSKLFIVSQTDDICGAVLEQQINFDGEIVVIECNKYSKKPVVEVIKANDFSRANSLTLGALAASNIKTDFGLVLNVMADDPDASMGVYFTKKIFGYVVDVTQAFVIRVSIALGVLLVLVSLLLWSLFAAINGSVQNIAADMNREIKSIDSQINSEKNTDSRIEIDLASVVDEVAQMNVSAVNFYDSIASDIPKNVWLTKYYNKAGSGLVIQGISENIASIYEYYKNLKSVSPQSDIKLTELKVITATEEDDKMLRNLNVNKDTDRLYSFEISNVAINVDSEDGKTQGQKINTKELGNIQPFERDEDGSNIIIEGLSLETPSKQMKPVE